MRDASTIGAGLLIVRRSDGKVLLLRRAEGGSKPGYWNPPGGTVEGSETPLQAALREAREELGALPPLEEFRRDDGYWHANGPYFAFATFLGVLDEKHEAWEPKLNDESSAWGWFSPDELPRPLVPGVGHAVRDLSSRVYRWYPPSHRMGIASPGTLSLLKVINLNPSNAFYMSTSVAIHDERTNHAVLITVPFEDGEPTSILMPVCRENADRDALLEHYQELLAQDPSLVFIAMDDVDPERVVDMAFAEASKGAPTEILDVIKAAVQGLVRECVR